MSEKFTARNNDFLSNAKEVLTKRAFFRLADEYNEGNVAECQSILDNADLAPEVLENLNALLAVPAAVRDEAPGDDSAPIGPTSDADLAKAPRAKKEKVVKEPKEPKAKKEKPVKEEAPPYVIEEDPALEGTLALDVIKTGIKDQVEAGVQLKFWFDLDVQVEDDADVEVLRKGATFVAARKTAEATEMVFKLTRRTFDFGAFNKVELHEQLDGDHRNLSGVSLNFLSNGETLVTWVKPHPVPKAPKEPKVKEPKEPKAKKVKAEAPAEE
jgi:hypothetical protein